MPLVSDLTGRFWVRVKLPMNIPVTTQFVTFYLCFTYIKKATPSCKPIIHCCRPLYRSLSILILHYLHSGGDYFKNWFGNLPLKDDVNLSQHTREWTMRPHASCSDLGSFPPLRARRLRASVWETTFTVCVLQTRCYRIAARGY